VIAAFGDLTLLVSRQEEHPACKNILCAGVVAFSALTESVCLSAGWTYCSSTARSMAGLHCRHVITTCSELWKVSFFGAVCDFFVCV